MIGTHGQSKAIGSMTQKAMTTVLVTGAQGFVGCALCDRLSADGYAVKRMVRTCQDENETAIGNISPDTDWHEHLKGCDVVAHLAARVHIMHDTATAPLTAYRESNTLATLNLARQASEAGVRRFVYLSSIKVNGESGCVGELDDPLPQDPYAISKWEAEQGLREITAQSAMEIVILRPPLVYGPGVKANFLRLIRWVDRGVPMPLASVHNQRSMIYLGNLVDALMIALVHPVCAGKTYLLSDGEDVSTPELMLRIAASLGRKSKLWSLPMGVLRLLGVLSGKSAEIDRLLGSLQVDVRPFCRDTGWKPPFTLAEGIEETANWYRCERSR